MLINDMVIIKSLYNFQLVLFLTFFCQYVFDTISIYSLQILLDYSVDYLICLYLIDNISLDIYEEFFYLTFLYFITFV